MTAAEAEARRQAAVRRRICATALGMVTVAMENLRSGIDGGKVVWSSKAESDRYDRVWHWLDESWGVIGRPHIGSVFFREHERVMLRVQDRVNESWLAGTWGVEEYGQYLLVCSRVVDDAYRLLEPGRRRAWKYLADTLAGFVALFMAAFGDSIEAVGGPASDVIADMILDGADISRRVAA